MIGVLILYWSLFAYATRDWRSLVHAGLDNVCALCCSTKEIWQTTHRNIFFVRVGYLVALPHGVVTFQITPLCRMFEKQGTQELQTLLL
ncbi:hypothetical protein EDC04DRAFT_2642526 [Pisolithus marmoratus]|nr:hypothetical protein EDC04DRAFT_2642526 [Pisolithus marmoratus]